MEEDLTESDGVASNDETLAGDAPQRRREPSISQGTLIGRYVVIGRIGAGGMGVVHAAYDPELDRKVAVKLLHVAPGGSHGKQAHTRLVREAQALAKLSHPNVVAVHDVGTVDERVWMAMEFVTGHTLDAWLSERARPWREVLRVVSAAGEGLAAAHAAGLLHRDFKPDNVMIDTGGRVRVMDFGLARAGSDPGPPLAPGIDEQSGSLSQRVTQIGSLVGTPRYMSPEQLAGKEIDARSDQFSLCVTLWLALYGRHPFEGGDVHELAARVLEGRLERPPAGTRVPGWLRRACTRGMATDPRQRYASVQELLDALARGQARARRRTLLAALAVPAVIGVGALGVERWQHARQLAACEAEGASITEVWNDEARAQLRAGILATGAHDAATTVDKVLPWIDGAAQSFREHQTRACIDGTVESRWDPEILERARGCLADRRHGIESLVQVLSHADDRVVRSAVKAAIALESSASCLDAGVLARLPPPPEPELRPRIAAVTAELAHAEALRGVGKYDEGLQVMAELRDEVEVLGWGPLSARTSKLESTLLHNKGSYADAVAAGTVAYVTAGESGAWADAADVAADLVAREGFFRARPAEGRLWAELARMAASLAGDPLRQREAQRDFGLGMIAFSVGEYEEARTRYDRALAIFEETLGPEHLEVVEVLTSLGTLAASRGALDEARQAWERAKEILEEVLGAEHPEVGKLITNLGVIDYESHDYPRAKASFEQSLALQTAAFGPDHPDVAGNLDNLGATYNQLGDPERALAMQLRALATWEKVVGPDHPKVAVSARLIGLTYVAQQRYQEALAVFERSVAIFERHEGIQYGEPEARFALIEMLVKTDGDRTRIRAEAEKARVGYRELGEGQAAELAELEALLAGMEEGSP
jgi:tetratricopeptide (TPR) repeat protein